MRICMILEGSYPYIRGGVSSWMHEYILALPQHEFVLWTIGALEKDRGVFKYELPSNVVEVREVFLDHALTLRYENKKKITFTQEENEAILSMMLCQDPDWEVLFDCYNRKKINPVAFLMSMQFLNLLKNMCREKHKFTSFSDLFYTIRSMFLPALYMLSQDVPEADIYHATATGYSGLLGSLATWRYKKPYMLTEHGIYTREREEEILRSNWVQPSFKDMWIDMFYMFSRCAYDHADQVTSLFNRASNIQKDIGCSPEKCIVIGNGIHLQKFIEIPEKEPDGWYDIGAVVRFAPIKDIKTMIYAFASLKAKVHNARLHILGDIDNQEYYEECTSLIDFLEVSNVLIVGSTNVSEYMKQLDFTILTSISEGQPLSIIESMASARSVVCTDVGCCRALVEGLDDPWGPAGICCAPMHYTEISEAMYKLCSDDELRRSYALAGRLRAVNEFDHKMMMDAYTSVYERMLQRWQA